LAYSIRQLPKEALNRSISLTPFGFAQESVRQARHERNQQVTVYPEPVEGFNQRFPKNNASDPVLFSTNRVFLHNLSSIQWVDIHIF
jgi:hypothetical protein